MAKIWQFMRVYGHPSSLMVCFHIIRAAIKLIQPFFDCWIALDASNKGPQRWVYADKVRFAKSHIFEAPRKVVAIKVLWCDILEINGNILGHMNKNNCDWIRKWEWWELLKGKLIIKCRPIKMCSFYKSSIVINIDKYTYNRIWFHRWVNTSEFIRKVYNWTLLIDLDQNYKYFWHLHTNNI